VVTTCTLDRKFSGLSSEWISEVLRLPFLVKENVELNLNDLTKSSVVLKGSVPDPKLIISDPDPKIENQEFRIQILDPDPSVN